jgi:hypothetical protein
VKAGFGWPSDYKMERTMKNLSFLFLLLAVFQIEALAQVKNTENTLKLVDGQNAEKASVNDMAWLAGGCAGTGLGGVSEEIWSKPLGGVMMGAYRLIKDDKPVFYEMLMLVEKEGSLVLRLKHFTRDFVGWEEKDKSVDFKFVSRSDRRMNFSGLTFERLGDKELKIYLALRQKDGSVREEIFTMKRTN